MSNVIKLEGKYVEKRIRKKGKVKFYTCNSCNTKYHEDLMISYFKMMALIIVLNVII